MKTSEQEQLEGWREGRAAILLVVACLVAIVAAFVDGFSLLEEIGTRQAVEEAQTSK